MDFFTKLKQVFRKMVQVVMDKIATWLKNKLNRAKVSGVAKFGDNLEVRFDFFVKVFNC